MDEMIIIIDRGTNRFITGQVKRWIIVEQACLIKTVTTHVAETNEINQTQWDETNRWTTQNERISYNYNFNRKMITKTINENIKY